MEKQSEWTWNLMSVLSSKASVRPANTKAQAWDLLGFDGTFQGGLRPHRGFRKIHDLGTTTLFNDSADYPFEGHSTVDFIQSVDFHIGAESYGYGVVYRAKRRTQPTFGDVFIDVWLPVAPKNTTYASGLVGGWNRGILLANKSVLTQPVSVATMGRIVFVFLGTRTPATFKLKKVDTEWSVEVEGVDESDVGAGSTGQPGVVKPNRRPGQGKKPGLIKGSNATLATSAIQLVEDAPTGGVLLEPGKYTFGIRLRDTKTNQISQLSEMVSFIESDFVNSAGDLVSKYVSLKLPKAEDIAVDSGLKKEHDQAILYRTSNLKTAGSAHVGSIMQFDGAYTLNPTSVTTGTVKKPDQEVITRDMFIERTTLDVEVPKAGLCVNFERTLVAGRIGESEESYESGKENLIWDTMRSSGELRWSSTLEPDPYAWNPANRFVPEGASNEIIALAATAHTLIGWSADRTYMFKKANGYLRSEEVHRGFGVVGPRAVVGVGPLAYFVNPRGLKAITAEGDLEDVKVVDQLLTEAWGSDLSAVELSHDTLAGTLCIHNARVGHLALMWFSTGRMTELTELPFTTHSGGPWPYRYDDGASATWGHQLVQRSMFLQNHLNPPTGHLPSVWVMDTEQLKAWPSLLEPQSPSLKLGTVGGGGTSVTWDSPSEGVTSDLLGCVLVSRTDPDVRWKVTAVTPGTALTLAWGGVGTAVTLVGGSTVTVSPVLCRWTGSNVGAGSVDPETGQPLGGTDLFRVKQLSSVGAFFSEATSLAVGSELVWRGLAYEGTDVVAAASGQLVAMSANVKDAGLRSAFGSSASPGKYGVLGASLSPAIQIDCSGFDFRLLATVAHGRLSSLTTARTT